MDRSGKLSFENQARNQFDHSARVLSDSTITEHGQQMSNKVRKDCNIFIFSETWW